MTAGAAAQTVLDAHERAVRGERSSFRMPAALGSGGIEVLCSCGGLSAYVHRLAPNRELVFSGRGADALCVHLCLGDGVAWQAGAADRPEGACREVEAGACYVQAGGGCETVCYAPGGRYEFVSVSFSGAARESLPELLGERGAAEVERAAAGGFSAAAGASARLLAADLLHEGRMGGFAGMYRHGKALELAAAAFSRLALGSAPARTRLSPSDRAALARVRDLLDACPVRTPTLSQLAHEALLSETRLTRGFRELYGTSVHAYAVERRLERARRLLEREGASVARAASEVGYGNPSHFSAAFKRRYGFAPSELARHAG